jgi:hypothetical protein
MELLRLRDLLVLAFVLLGVFQCYYQPISYDYHLDPVWFVELFDNDAPHESISELVAPVVIDLDRDNVKDLISVGLDNVLRVS